MATLAGIQKQIASLEKQAEAIRKTEATAAVSKAKELIARFNLSAEDLGLVAKAGKKVSVKPTSAKVKATAKPAGVAKYRDPKTGKTWTGNGKPPGWIAIAKSRDKFLINAGSVSMEPMTAIARAPAESKPAAKAARKKTAPATKAVTRKTPVKKAMATKPAEVKAAAAPVTKAKVKKSTAKKAATGTDAAGGTAAATPAHAPGV